MNQPEFILAEPEKTPHTGSQQDCTNRDWSGVVVELEQSLLACKLVIDLLEQITSSLRVSVQSLQEQV